MREIFVAFVVFVVFTLRTITGFGSAMLLSPILSAIIPPKEAVVSKKDVNTLIPKLKSLGAEDIIELNISKIVK